jgi:2-amino-4-hydroxy-6-hydroxymethyldihydropteridine diphosphokinase
MTTAYLALGSNIGNRAANLRDACSSLEERGIVIAARSKLYETQSVEGGGPGDFLNAALRIETVFTAYELMRCCQQIEEQLGRPQPPRSGPRTVDIDLLFFDNEKIDTPELRLPHPRMHYRTFVLRPLCDVLEGGWLHELDESL